MENRSFGRPNCGDWRSGGWSFATPQSDNNADPAPITKAASVQSAAVKPEAKMYKIPWTLVRNYLALIRTATAFEAGVLDCRS